MNTDQWNEEARKAFEGATIEEVRYLNDKEVDNLCLSRRPPQERQLRCPRHLSWV